MVTVETNTSGRGVEWSEYRRVYDGMMGRIYEWG